MNDFEIKQKRDSRIMWGGIFALILLSGILSALWPAIGAPLVESLRPSVPEITLGGGPELEAAPSDHSGDFVELPIDLPFELPGLLTDGHGGVSTIALAALMAGGILGAMVAGAVPLFFLFKMLDGIVSGVKEDEAYQTKVKAFQTTAKDEIKAAKKSAPASGKPNHERNGWSAISTAIVSAVMAYLFGYAGGISLNIEPSVVATWFAVSAFLIALVMMRPNFFAMSTDGEKAELNWGLLWVVVSGLIVVGLGTGLVALFRAGAGG